MITTVGLALDGFLSVEQRIGTGTDYRIIPGGCADVIIAANGKAVAVGLADRAVIHHISG